MLQASACFREVSIEPPHVEFSSLEAGGVPYSKYMQDLADDKREMSDG